MSNEVSLGKPIVRSEDLWFKDGTIVLQAENVLFRVYSGLLSKHSQFFEQLFSLPQPPDAEQYDGCPLIKLAGDAAEDIRNFLLMIHEIGFPNALIDDAVALAALLTLSTKYEVTHLRQRILGVFSPFCPTTLSAYCTLSARERSEGGHSFKLMLPLNTIPKLTAVSNAVSVAAPTMLPFTLLRLLRISNSDTSFILGGALYEDRRLYLKPQLQDAVIKGRAYLTRLARKFVYPTIFTTPCANNHITCESRRAGVLAKIYRTDGYLEPFRHPEDLFSPFCTSCKNKFEADVKSGRETVWRELPAAFGLPGWHDLAKTTRAESA